MFKFSFDVDGQAPADPAEQHLAVSQESHGSCTQIPLVELLDSLAPLLSYSPIKIPLSASKSELVLPRRDLFDARFQLISQAGDDKEIDGLQYLEAPSDLVSGVYEGGLKTWECSLDLVDVLDQTYNPNELTGKRILEIGCGTAIPSLYLLSKIWATVPKENNPETHIHLQDFNRSVLELVTLPNIVLTWYMSPASESYRDALREETTESEPDPDAHPLPPADPTEASELPVNPSLLAGFLESLTLFNLHIDFTYGPWNTFIPEHRFNIVLTSETIYQRESLSPLLDVIWKASTTSYFSDKTLDELAASKLVSTDSDSQACYVAGKILYFGVGGGIPDFVDAVENPQKSDRGKGEVETIKEHTQGVARKVLRVRW